MFGFAALSLLLPSGVLCLSLRFVGVFTPDVHGVAVEVLGVAVNVLMGVPQRSVLLGVETIGRFDGIIVLRQSVLFERSF